MPRGPTQLSQDLEPWFVPQSCGYNSPTKSCRTLDQWVWKVPSKLGSISGVSCRRAFTSRLLAGNLIFVQWVHGRPQHTDRGFNASLALPPGRSLRLLVVADDRKRWWAPENRNY